jgi:hypothetical protein
MAAEHGWQRKFEDPIPLPNGDKLITLRDDALYATFLPAEEAAPLRRLRFRNGRLARTR